LFSSFTKWLSINLFNKQSFGEEERSQKNYFFFLPPLFLATFFTAFFFAMVVVTSSRFIASGYSRAINQVIIF